MYHAPHVSGREKKFRHAHSRAVFLLFILGVKSRPLPLHFCCAYLSNEVMIFATLIEPLEKIDFIKTDPSDNKVLECAVDSHSDYIVTYDARHLLSLKEFRGIKLVEPEDLLALILS